MADYQLSYTGDQVNTAIGQIVDKNITGTLTVETLDLTNPLAITQGGTGATTAAAARENLGIKSCGTYDILPIAQGGTGKTTAAEALKALGGASIKKVWTNASIGSAFGAQTLQIPTTADYILILTVRGETIVVPKNAGKIIHYGCEGYPTQRGFTYTDNSLIITIGEALNSGWQTDNNMLKPWYIFEINGVI